MSYHPESQRRYRASPKGRNTTQTQEKERHRALRVSLLMLLGGRCVRCGFNDMRALQVDHVNGGGSREPSPSRSRLQGMMLRYLQHQDIQVLCANCNWIKKSERREVR